MERLHHANVTVSQSKQVHLSKIFIPAFVADIRMKIRSVKCTPIEIDTDKKQILVEIEENKRNILYDVDDNLLQSKSLVDLRMYLGKLVIVILFDNKIGEMNEPPKPKKP